MEACQFHASVAIDRGTSGLATRHRRTESAKFAGRKAVSAVDFRILLAKCIRLAIWASAEALSFAFFSY